VNREIIRHLITASRPKTLPASLSPIIVGLTYSHHLHVPLSLATALLTIVVALLLQISTNLVNDYYDALSGIDKNRTLGPVRVTQQGLLTPKQVKQAFLFTFALAAMLVVPLVIRGEFTMLILSASCFLAAFLYTGGPFPLSHFALGELFAFLFFGPIAVWGTYFLQSLDLSIVNFVHLFLIGTPTGFISAQIMSINNLRDRQTDNIAKKITIATLLPKKQARLVPFIFLLLSLTIPILLTVQSSYLIFLILLAPLPFFKRWKCLWSEQASSKFNDSLAATGQYMFLHALIFGSTLWLSQ